MATVATVRTRDSIEEQLKKLAVRVEFGTKSVPAMKQPLVQNEPQTYFKVGRHCNSLHAVVIEFPVLQGFYFKCKRGRAASAGGPLTAARCVDHIECLVSVVY